MKKIKIVLCLLLSAVMALSCCPVSLASAQPLKLLVVSDIHLKSTEAVGDLRETDTYSDTDAYYDATIQGQMSNVSEAIIRQFFKQFLEAEEEILLIAGDLTSSAKPVDHECLRDIMRSTLDEAAARGLTKRIFVINGNHDIDDDDTAKFTSAEEFKTCYRDFGYGEALTVDESSCSYTAELDENHRLIAADSCIYGADDGEFNESRLSWIKAQTEQARADGKTPILMCHHSVARHFSVQSIVKSEKGAVEALSDLGIRYAFTGHMHANDISCIETKNGNKLYDIMTGSLITAPCTFRKVSFGEQEVKIGSEYLHELDAVYLPEGLNAAQRELLTERFDEYKGDFFTKGIGAWVAQNLCTAHFIAKKLKLKEGTKAYEAADYLTSCLGSALQLPLYEGEDTPGEYDSFEELASACGHVLPESGYKTASEAAASIVKAFYAGDENIRYTDTEIQLLLGVFSTGITYAVTKLLTGGAESDKAEALFRAIGAGTAKVKGTKLETLLISKNAADIIVGAAVIPLLESITADEYSPSDLNVTLEGTAQTAEKADSPAPTGFGKLLLNFLKSFISTLLSLLK